MSMRAACVKRVQPEPAASQFSKHSLLINYALGPACDGLRRPAVVSMRRYVRNTKSADAVVPMVLDKTNACQRSDCAESGNGTTLSSFALSRQELEKMDLQLCRFKVRFSSPTLEMVLTVIVAREDQAATVSAEEKAAAVNAAAKEKAAAVNAVA